jgi:hypothetical protein
MVDFFDEITDSSFTGFDFLWILFLCIFIFLIWNYRSVFKNIFIKKNKEVFKPLIRKSNKNLKLDLSLKKMSDSPKDTVLSVSYNNTFTNQTDESLFDMADIDYYRNIKLPEYEPRKLSLYEIDKLNETIVSDNTNDIPDDNAPINQHILTHINNQITYDSQNVHDSFVQKDSSKLYLSSNTPSNKDFVNESVSSFIDRTVSIGKEEKLSKTNTILQEIKSRNATLTNFDNNTETEILNNTWEKSISDNQKNSFIDALFDSVENNILLCPTGLCTRIISNLHIENPENMPKSKYLYNQEILHKASIMRNDSPDASIEDFKQSLITQSLTDYPHLTHENISDIINPWINEI